MSDAVRAGSMPRGVRAVVSYGMVAGILQVVAAAVVAPVLAREVDVVLGVVVGVALVVLAAVTITSTVLLQRGSERARRLVAWPADREAPLLDLGAAGWARRHLRSPEAVRWFAARADARARRSGGPR